ncbi:type II toxin-antitoxin system MqsA family antitoxin [Bacillus tianshenii]|uniref:type II toxin-antitoxin system MqsA family antitoxin n=1 Tax=Sutcliffiella tianshenii TaxID=1463404 RepID=UPI001CD2074B|nr:type II toxin-antitoxin system MqsA family antitoxin [Bacillus tianshenii]MCA1318312.1 type II toxin-antitoxin system MqsA family antitoxin [Bacillus tianshenii]
MTQTQCPKCSHAEFAEGTDYMRVKPLDKPFGKSSQKIYTFCLGCGEVVSTRIENPAIFRK